MSVRRNTTAPAVRHRVALLAGVLVAASALLAIPDAARADSEIATISGIPGSSLGHPLALSADGTRLYAANGASSTISVIDTATDTVISTIDLSALGHSVGSLALVGSTLYATGVDAVGGGGDTDPVFVIDTASETVTGQIEVGDGPSDLVASPDGTRVYAMGVNGVGATSVSVVDTATNTRIAYWATSASGARHGAISSDGSRLYVSRFAGVNATIVVFDTATGATVTTIAAGTSATRLEAMAISPDGATLYAVAPLQDAVRVLDTASATFVGDPIPVGDNPSSIVAHPDGRRVYVANAGGNSLAVIDIDTGGVASTVAVGAGPRGVVLTPDGTTAYVGNVGASTVSVVALDQWPAIGSTSLPVGSTDAAYSAGITATGTPAPTFAVTAGALPPGLTLDPVTGAVTGSPTTEGFYTFTVTASSTVSGIPGAVQQVFTIEISAAAVAPTPGDDPPGGELARSGADPAWTVALLGALALAMGAVAVRSAGTRRPRQWSRGARCAAYLHEGVIDPQ